MNYIRHMSAFFEKISSDHRLNPSHVSLYIALFQLWNVNRFENPISINRSQLMILSKIGSEHTYYRDLYDLHAWGYIRYFPSRNPIKGSLVNMCNFDISCTEVLVTPVKSTQAEQPGSCKNDISTAQAVHPSLNIINTKNMIDRSKINNPKYELKNSGTMKSKNEEKENLREKKKLSSDVRNETLTNVGKSVKNDFVPPPLLHVKIYFDDKGFPSIEAEKFFNYFQSNGWLVGGRAKMKDWRAAARNWMLNCTRFSNQTISTKRNTQNISNLNNKKNYNEPL